MATPPTRNTDTTTIRIPRQRQPADTQPARPINPHATTPGHPDAEGTWPLAVHLTDPAIEEEIQQLAATAPPMTEDQRARLARLLRLN